MKSNGALATFEIVKRNLKRNFRVPQLLFFSSLQPVLFLLLFNFVFGGAVQADPSVEYINYLLPGILAQTALFGAIQTGVGLAEDLEKGVIVRFKSLPIARYSVLAGRTIADGIRTTFVLCLMIIVGFLLGFSYSKGLLNFIGAIALISTFAFAFSWAGALTGLLVKDSETVQVTGFMWVFPMVFASSVFVPIESMPSWLQVFARNQPVSQAVNAMRHLTQGGIENGGRYILVTLAWVLGATLLFAPIAVWKYKKVS